MRILFDARVLGAQMHGIARYGSHLLDGLLSQDLENEYLILTGPEGRKESFPQTETARWISTPIPLYSLREQWQLSILLRSEKFDLYHSPTYTLPLAFVRKGLLTIHDLIHLVFPKDYSLLHRIYYRMVLRPAVARCLHVFTVSDHSKKDIQFYLKGNPDKITVTPNGIDSFWSPRPESPLLSPDYGLGSGYLLFVGNSKPHKNIRRVVAAFQKLVREQAYPGKLVVVGLTLQPFPPELADRIINFPHCSDEELQALYSRAQLLLAPSLYEGFGLPVLEAMACGCPVLVGNRSSLPEIVGRAGIQVDPFQVEAIVQGIKKVLDDPGLSRELTHQGLQRAQEYSWEKTTRIVLNTYKALGRTLKK